MDENPRQMMGGQVVHVRVGLIIVFLDSQEIIHQEFFRQGSTVTGAFHKDVLHLLKCWTAETGQFLGRRLVVTMDYTPYSPDVFPLDYCPFPKLKLKMKGQRYELIEAIEAVVTRELQSVEVVAFDNAFTDLYTRSKRCIEVQVDYVEAR
ncbi:hypothetical protein QE152_g1329 [Popillia japonica]|uniref:Uncharacterized protein n=1 Tax=Popillia japonica TaxID=7064 RepID=A0AAW1N387_POPJA